MPVAVGGLTEVWPWNVLVYSSSSHREPHQVSASEEAELDCLESESLEDSQIYRMNSLC